MRMGQGRAGRKHSESLSLVPPDHGTTLKSGGDVIDYRVLFVFAT